LAAWTAERRRCYSSPSPGVINGYGWVNLGTLTNKTFTLAKPGAPALHSHWQDDALAPGKQAALLASARPASGGTSGKK
jgi:hypothetical protein